MGEERLSGNQPPSNRRLTVPQAAAALGVTEGALWGRVKRGTLRSYRESGKVYVLLEGVPEGVSSTSNRDEPSGPQSDQSRLIAVLREQIAYLQGVIATRDQELDTRAEEIRRRDEEIRRRDAALEREQHLAAGFAKRLRALEAPDRQDREGKDTPRDAGQDREAPQKGVTTTPMPAMETSPFTVGAFAVGTGIAAAAANPLLVSLTGNPFLLAVLALWLFPPIFGYWLGRDTASLRARLFAEIEAFRKMPTPSGSESEPVSPKQEQIDDLQGRLESLPNRAPRYAGIVAITTAYSSVGMDVLIRTAGIVGVEMMPAVPAMIGVNVAQVVLAAMFVLSTSFLGLGRARQRAEAARPDAGAGTTAEASAAKSQARWGLVGTIISALIGLIGTILTVMAPGNGG